MNQPIKLAVVGGGQMGRALACGMLAAKVIAPGDLRLVERNRNSRGWWAANQPGIAITELNDAVRESDVVILAVKPYSIAAVAQQPSGFWDRKLVASVAAGVDLDALTDWIGHARVVRVMPNTPSVVRAGACGFCCASDADDSDRETIRRMFDAVGLAVEVTEKQMDAVTGLSGSGPAYVCLMIEALADGGVLAGLPRPLAMQLATQTVLGTAKMVADTGRHPAELKDSVCSPGGTTIAAIATLEHNGFRSALIEAVAASARRSREMNQ